MQKWACAILLAMALIVTAAALILVASTASMSALPVSIPVVDGHQIPTVDAHTIMGTIPTRY